jgi:hypothetical protein
MYKSSKSTVVFDEKYIDDAKFDFATTEYRVGAYR